MDDLLCWPVFRLLGRSLLSSVRLARVFNEGRAALYSDNTDTTHLAQVTITGLQTRVLDKLWGEEVVAFETGKPSLALCREGKVFSCGVDCDVNGTILTSSTQLDDIREAIHQHRITGVACGKSHTVALTSEGRVLCWGSNGKGQCGLVDDISENQPPQIIRELEDIRLVTASNNASACLSEQGKIYVWGCIGNGPSQWAAVPVQQITGSSFSRLALGRSFGLALTNEGTVVTWGKTEFTHSVDKIVPINIPGAGLKRFSEVAADKHGLRAAATCIDGGTFTWIYDENGTPRAMEQTPFHDLDHVFAFSNGRLGTYRTVQLVPSSFACVKKAFDNPEDSDLQFIVERKPIYVHRTLLKLKSDYYRGMLNGAWKESEQEVKISANSYDVYRAMLKFFYTEQLDIDFDGLPELLRLAHETMNHELVRECCKQIPRHLNADNVCTIYVLARDLGLEDLCDSTRQFAKACLPSVLRSEAFASMPEKANEFICSVVGNPYKNKRKMEDESGDGPSKKKLCD